MDLSQLRVCKRPNGDDWVLGQGTFGTVCTSVCSTAVNCLRPVKTPRSDNMSVTAWSSSSKLFDDAKTALPFHDPPLAVRCDISA